MAGASADAPWARTSSALAPERDQIGAAADEDPANQKQHGNDLVALIRVDEGLESLATSLDFIGGESVLRQQRIEMVSRVGLDQLLVLSDCPRVLSPQPSRSPVLADHKPDAADLAKGTSDVEGSNQRGHASIVAGPLTKP